MVGCSGLPWNEWVHLFVPSAVEGTRGITNSLHHEIPLRFARNDTGKAHSLMDSAVRTFSAGMPVEVARIERELKKLWQQGDEVMMRASLMNLAVYSEAPDSLARNTQLVSAITEDHACRAIVIAADPSAPADHVEAWISAHCHVSRAGSRQICSEQLSFSLRGSSANLLPNIVFSHLDSDLPLYLWWQGEFHNPMDPQLWSWVDRLIYDSQSWSNFGAQMKLVEEAQKNANHRVVLCDLNWTRLVHVRLALAQFFDAPAMQARLAKIERVAFAFASGCRSTVVLLAGWLAAQLRWELVASESHTQMDFLNGAGQPITVALTETPGAPISRCTLYAGDIQFRVNQATAADRLDVCMHSARGERMQRLMPAGSNEPAQLMDEELMRGGPHRVYLRAVQAVRQLL